MPTFSTLVFTPPAALRTVMGGKKIGRVDALLKAKHPPYTRFPNDSLFSQVDRKLSLALASLPIVEPFEFCVFAFGHIFGCPLTALWWAPCFFLSLQPVAGGGEWSYQQAYASVVMVSTFLLLLLVYHNRIQLESLSKGSVIVAAIAGTLGTFHWIDATAFKATCTYYTCWVFLNGFCWVWKGFFLRERPAAVVKASGMERRFSRYTDFKIWKALMDTHTNGKNAAHSFPSFDSATGGCVLGMVLTMNGLVDRGLNWAVLHSIVASDTTSMILLGTCCLAMYGRIYVLAHHVSDVMVGASLGLGLPIFVAFFSPSGHNAYHLVWAILTLVCVLVFFFVPGKGVYLSILVVFTMGYVCPEISWVIVAMYGGLMGLVSVIYHAQSRRVKPWTVKRLEEYFDGIEDPDDFPPHLITLLKEKRKEFLDECHEENSVFPGNLYIASQFLKDTHFVMDWKTLKATFLKRLEHFVEHTKVNPEDIDVIVGIYSGGAFFAPLLAQELNRPVCFIKASRYAQLKLSFWEFGKTAMMRALGLHDSAYKLSKLPDPSIFPGKRVLMVDDASVSGGTFRAVAQFCTEAGAAEVRGLAFAGAKSKATHIWDPTMKHQPTEQKIDMPAFSPWGSF